MALELVCLGVGNGMSAVYTGETSSAFLLRYVEDPWMCTMTGSTEIQGVEPRGVPLLLIDCGLAVTCASLAKTGSMAEKIYVSHNHTDHAGELPVVLAVERARGKPRTVIAERRVAQVLQERRLYETTPSQAYSADWILCDEGKVTPIGDGLALEPVASAHSELCFGFILYVQLPDAASSGAPGQPLFGFSGDSAYCKPLLDRISQAPLMLVDARKVGNAEHASFDEITQWKEESGYKGSVVIYHYGSWPADAPQCLGYARPGDAVRRWDKLGCVLP